MGLLDGIADTLDNAAGSVDESVSRQFDDEAGGGFGDETIDFSLDTIMDDRPNNEDTVDLPGGSASEETANAFNSLVNYGLSNPAVGLFMALVAAYMLGQLFDVQLGGRSSA